MKENWLLSTRGSGLGTKRNRTGNCDSRLSGISLKADDPITGCSSPSRASTAFIAAPPYGDGEPVLVMNRPQAPHS
jgi:hypothetical protein